MTPRNLLGEWARLLVESLVASGIRDVVISPGSRSTPFTWAALKHPKLRCRVLIDERSAGFFALGQAKMTGVPSALICTSGSALANYFPAVVEADASATPLVIVSADRPYELQGCAAAQTIDQVKIFGSFVRNFTDLAMPDSSDGALRALAQSVGRAVHAARFPQPGPVHLNARARKPLEPEPAQNAEELELRARVSALIERGPSACQPPEVAAPQVAVQGLASACRSTGRGLIVCGPAPIPAELGGVEARALLRLAALSGFPILCEATSQVRFASNSSALVCDAFDWLCGSALFTTSAAPALILQFGRPPTSGHYERLLQRHPSVQRHVIAPYDWPDPTGRATSIVRGEPRRVVEALCAKLAETQASSADPSWLALFERANGLAWQAVSQELEETTDLTEASAVKLIVSELAEGALLAIGNSLPVRELDWFCPALDHDIQVWSQRGANGIDGVLSGALGAASTSKRPMTLLVGDISFLHDVGGLYAASAAPGATLVVLNNRGGRIFEQLPIARTPNAETPDLGAWLTPHELDLEHAARLFQLDFARVSTRAELVQQLRQPSTSGARVIEVLVSPPSTPALVGRIAARFEQQLTREPA